MKVTRIESWQCRRSEHFFDKARTGRSPMDWDLVVLRLTTDTGLKGARHRAGRAQRGADADVSPGRDRAGGAGAGRD